MTQERHFRLIADEITAKAVGYGACLASDRITVDGKRVGYCYREDPDHATDSGWRFFAGDESQEYAGDPQHFACYDINTIANYDPGIASIVESAIGSAFERTENGHWRAVDEGEAQ